MLPFTFSIDSDNVLTIDSLKNGKDNSYINNATVTVTLTDTNGNNISGEVWPLSVPYVAASFGKYQVTLADTLSVSEEDLIAEIVADGGPGLKKTWKLTFFAEYASS